MTNSLQNLHTIQKELEDVAKLSPHTPKTPQVIAISKYFTKEDVLPLIKANHRLFGENKVQEAWDKWTPLKQTYPDLCLHLVGSLQSNKVDKAITLFDVIETLDRPSLAQALHQEWTKNLDHFPDLFIQVNTGAEEQKGGVLPKDASPFIQYCCKELKLPVKGLMCIPPADEPAAIHFSYLRTLAIQHDLSILSMGMSQDYKIAAQFGASYVRVGQAIFGKRPT